MSSDSTKLTFVRCPSCRSLVPAVSTRCRMCGATLDTSDESEELQHEHKPSGRVRQRTMSQPENVVMEAADQLRQGEAASEQLEQDESFVDQPDEAAEVSEPGMSDYERDPLADFIEESDDDYDVEEEKESFEQGVAEELEDALVDQDNEVDDFSIDQQGESDMPLEPEDNDPSPQDFEQQTEDPADHNIRSKQGQSEDAPVRKAPEVIVESGSRRSGGLSFGRPVEKQIKESKEDSVVQESRRALHEKQKLGRRRTGRDRTERGSQLSNEDRRASAVSGSHDLPSESVPVQPRQIEKRQETFVNESSKPRSATSQVQAEEAFGRLYGWLVSYADPAGTSIELREGKFFLTKNSLKDTDLVIPDASISTPHAMFTISVKTGLVVQDLMSDRGVFVRRVNADTYKREDGAVVVEHGDWLRFGDVEFVVTLVAHVGQE